MDAVQVGTGFIWIIIIADIVWTLVSLINLVRYLIIKEDVDNLPFYQTIALWLHGIGIGCFLLVIFANWLGGVVLYLYGNKG